MASTTLIHTADPVFPSEAHDTGIEKPSLVGLGRKEIAAHLENFGIEPKKIRMRTKQIFHWIYNYGVTEWDSMTNIAKPLRLKLSEHFTLDRPEIIERQISVDGTRKYLVRMAPGIEVESVFIPDVSKTGALCVSSQVGCTLTCKFCHTGTQRLVRNLTPREIVLQVIIARDDLGEWPTTQDNRKLTNIVFMGMGEPLYNTEAVGDSLDVICDPEGLGIGRRRITVSTSGVVPEIGPMGERTSAMLAIPWPGSEYECSDWETIETFSDIVNRAGYASPIRTPRGRDILAACGQLKSESEKKRASAIRAENKT